MNYADRFLNRPLMLSAARAASLHALVSKQAVTQPDTLSHSPSLLERRGDVGVIQIHGTLVHRSSMFDAMFGFTSYEAIAEALDEAEADEDVKRVVLDVDSPGGEVSGAFAVADKISSFPKPTTAVAADMAASAAYLLIAGADEIVTERTAALGSIGVIALHVSQYDAEREAGFTVREIVSGDRKAEGSSHRPLDPASEASIRAEVDTIAGLFFDHVATARGVSRDQIEAQQAAVYLGTAAVAAGLADRVGTLDAVIGVTTVTRREGMMTDSTMHASVADAVEIADVVNTTIVEPETTAEDKPEDAVAETVAPVIDPVAEAVLAERERVARIERLTLNAAIAKQAKSEGWTLERFLEVQTVAEAARPSRGVMLDVPVSASVACATVAVPTTLDKSATDEEIKTVWDNTKTVRDEFTSFDSFRALARRWGHKL